MTRRLIPHVSLCRWHSHTEDLADAHGWSVVLRWLGVVVELCWGVE